MPGVEHEFDIRGVGDPNVIGKSLELFEKALEKWLACFEPKHR